MSREDSLRLIKSEIEALPEFLSLIETMEDETFDREIGQRLNRINDLAELVPENRKELMNWCFEVTGKELNSSKIMRHAREKPLGYPGDFQLIDWIYTNNPQSDGKGLLWDRMFLRQPATQAVRNRKEFFITILSSFKTRKVSVLNIACGPCREILDAVQMLSAKNSFCFFHCVDYDHRAITYAKELIKYDVRDLFEIEWEVSNVFSFHPEKRYDFIWVSGLFDYLDSRLSTALIRKMWQWLENGGKIVVGNFHPSNPNKNHMEWCLGWFLFHRTERELVEICRKARIPDNCITFKYEPLGINLFLLINKV